MFKILLFLTFSFLGFPHQGQFTITTHDRQEKTCVEFLNTQEYKDFIEGFKHSLENQGFEDIEVIKETCEDLSSI